MNDRNAAILWAQSILNNPDNYYILDTETTGIEKPEIIELGVIDLTGNKIINQRFRPITAVSAGASNIHGMTNASLQDEPPFDSVMDCLLEVVLKRKLLIYNAGFDRMALYHSFANHKKRHCAFDDECVMGWYSQFCGEWNDYRGSYRWQKLPGGDHSAVGDCLATLEVIKGMAASPMQLNLQPLKSQAV